METGEKRKTGYFRKYSYFDSDFPFSIRREIDLPCDYNESKRFRREFWKIIYIIDGFGEKLINSERYPLQPGSIFMIHPEDETTFNIRSEHLEIYNILFMPELVRDGLRELQDDFDFFSIMHWDLKNRERPRERLYVTESDMEIRRIVKTMEREFDRMPQNYRSRLKLLLLELLIILARKGNLTARHQATDQVVNYVDHLIDAHYAEEFRLDTLARNIGIDKSRLCRIYRAGTGQTIMDSVRIRRLNEAAELLTSTNRNISEICFASGFNDLSYFYRCFTEKFGANPGAFRKKFIPDNQEKTK